MFRLIVGLYQYASPLKDGFRRTQQNVTVAGTPTTTDYSYNAANQLVSDGTNTLTYDDNGNLTSDGVNIFVERLWRTVKYEDLYLKGYTTVTALASGLEEYFQFYNYQRPHQSLDYPVPADAYFAVTVPDPGVTLSTLVLAIRGLDFGEHFRDASSLLLSSYEVISIMVRSIQLLNGGTTLDEIALDRGEDDQSLRG